MNRKFFKIFLSALLAGSLLFFTACPTEAEDPGETKYSTGDEGTVQELGGGVKTLSFTIPGNSAIWYFSLGAGKWLKDSSDPYTADWDLAFQDSRIILTNSGDTEKRLNSGGIGGVWFTNQTGFDAVTSPAAGTLAGTPEDPDPGFNYLPYHTDYKRFVRIMGVLHTRYLNVMTYVGYPYENTSYGGGTDSYGKKYPAGVYNGSTEEFAFAGHGYLINFDYNKKAYYVNPPLPNGGLRMPPDFEATGQVYIVRHGGGTEYSKFQVTEFFRDFSANPNTDTYTIKWYTWPEGTEGPEEPEE
jgi:hypothetical protein